MSEQSNQAMPHETIVVEDGISLKQLRLEDSQELFEVIDKNRDYLAKWLPWPQYNKVTSDSEAFISNNLEKRRTGAEYGYGILIEGKICGHTSLMHLNDDKTPEIGYWISEDVSGQGITSRVARTLTDFGLGELGLEEIVIRADSNNIGSNRVAEKIGYSLVSQEPEENRIINTWSIRKS